MPLVQAERAWSYAMQLKRQGESGQGLSTQDRHKLHRRMAKATVHSAELLRLCATTSSPRVGLEAEAYHMSMRGTHLFTVGADWRGALAKLTRAKYV